MGGLDALHAMRLLVPPAWHRLDYDRCGPARVLRVLLSRTWSPGTGRRASCSPTAATPPARWIATDCVRRASSSRKNRFLTIASETGVWDYAPEDVVRKGKLGPGDMIALDLQTGTLLESRDIDEILKSRHPYKAWLKKGVRYLETDLVDPRLAAEPHGSRHAGALPEDVQRHRRGARRNHPRARRGRERGGRLDGRRHARCRCCRTRSARCTTISASSSRR